jgi:hypothetical protein
MFVVFSFHTFTSYTVRSRYIFIFIRQHIKTDKMMKEQESDRDS